MTGGKPSVPANTIGRSWLLDNIASPYGLAMISYALFLLAWLIPPSVYSHYMREPDLMFLDPATILFYSLCVAGFMAGVWSVGWLFPSRFERRVLKTRISPATFLLVPLMAAVLLSIAANIYLMVHFPNTVLLLLSKQGGDIKDTLNLEEDSVSGHLGFVSSILAGITWWSYWRYKDLDLKGWSKRSVISLLTLATISAIAFSALTVSRNTLLLLVCGAAILYVIRRTISNRINAAFYLKLGACLLVSISLLFMAFSFLRGTANWDDQINSLIGYTVASYNRLAAVLNGSLRYPYAGHGMYLSNVAIHSRLLPFKSTLNPPEYLEVWGSEFGAVSQAGLDGNLIWSGAFGYIFSDIGWFSVIFLTGYGILYGFVWNLMKRGKTLGVVLYPCFGFCVLFWVGSNYLLDAPLEILLLVTICLMIYESLLVKASVTHVVT